MAQWLRICLPMQEMPVQSLGGEDPLEEEMATFALWTFNFAGKFISVIIDEVIL